MLRAAQLFSSAFSAPSARTNPFRAEGAENAEKIFSRFAAEFL